MRELPRGTVTLLFSDIEGSTRLLHELGTDAYGAALAEHRRVLRDAFARHDGVEVDTQGDAFFVAFARASDAIAAARDAQAALAGGRVRVRMGVHTGEPLVTEEGYVGADVHKAARICAAAHGGQVIVSQAARDLVDGDLRELGAHRLKDMTSPERLYQLGDGDHPPPKALNRTNLPVQLSPLVGRERELADVRELVLAHRLVTVTGAGGSGKTRLALQAAADVVDDFPDGVWWVPLQAVRDGSLVLPTIAHAIGARDDLALHVGDRRLLLVLDNMEQLLDAAAPLVGLLGRCERLHVLVTSREPLRVGGEREYAVPPLAPSDAAALFLDRGRAIDPAFDATAEAAAICGRLDGLPLAIELAASRVKVLTPRQILERLERRLDLLTGGGRDAPERQRTMRATIEWSYDLLAPEEQALLRRLAVFAGPWTLEAAEEVAAADIETLASLVSKSLVRREGERFTMLGTIQEYARERLAASDDEETPAAHARYYGALAAREGIQTPIDLARLRRLAADIDNVRTALAYFVERRDGPSAVALAASTRRLWLVQGLLVEGRSWLERALALPSTELRARGEALCGLSFLAHRQGAPDAEAHAREALAIMAAIGDLTGVGHAQRALAQAVARDGRWAEAEAAHEAARAAFRAAGDDSGLFATLNDLADITLAQGRAQEAERLLDEALRIGASLGRDLIGPRLNAAIARVMLGDTASARPMFAEALRTAHELGSRDGVHIALLGVARCEAEAGEAAAGLLLAVAERLFAETGYELLASERPLYERAVEQVGPERLAAARDAAAAVSADEAVLLALRSNALDGEPVR